MRAERLAFRAATVEKGLPNLGRHAEIRLLKPSEDRLRICPAQTDSALENAERSADLQVKRLGVAARILVIEKNCLYAQFNGELDGLTLS
jgi:hypothetical protein